MSVIDTILAICFCTPAIVFGQSDSKIKEYQHYQIFKNHDTINYYVYSKGDIKQKKGFIIFFQGSGKEPLFGEGYYIDTIKNAEKTGGEFDLKKRNYRYNSVPFDLNKIPEKYAFVLITKKGIPFLVTSKGVKTPPEFKAPQSFYQTESLDYRVWQGDQVIKDIKKKLIRNPDKVIVIGHSEGSDVVAKLGVINKEITHIGYWAGGGNTQYYDFVMFIRKSVIRGEITEEQGRERIDSLLLKIKDIESEPRNIDKRWLGHTYQRWSTFTEPSIDNLLKINVPLFVAVGAQDNSVPVESSYLIPVEFARHKKNNLTFKVYPGYDHSFRALPKTPDEQPVNNFMNVFEEFMHWAENI